MDLGDELKVASWLAYLGKRGEGEGLLALRNGSFSVLSIDMEISFMNLEQLRVAARLHVPW